MEDRKAISPIGWNNRGEGMSREIYIERSFSAASTAIIQTANDICENYAQQGYDLSLRQLYYQFVSRALLPNTEQNYKRLGSIISDARLAGLLDWDYIKDRGRETPVREIPVLRSLRGCRRQGRRAIIRIC